MRTAVELALLSVLCYTLTATESRADGLPRDLKGCVLWLRADSGIVTDANGGIVRWLDQSGSGHDLDRLAGNAPVLATGLNGQSAVRFDGGGHLDASRDFGGSLSAHTLLLLARWTDVTPAHCRRIWSDPGRNWGFGYLDGDDQGWIADTWVYQKGWNVYGPGSLNTGWHLHTGTIDGAVKPWVGFWKDDTQLMGRTLGIDPRSAQPRHIALGGPPDSLCEVAEVLVYDRALSDAELPRLWNYFSSRYHISTPAVTIPGSPPEQPQGEGPYPIAQGPFHPNWRSFKQYRCPEWFRDAKLGIWAHWSPQCQPEQGDWYARHMYEQGSRQYEYHVAHYGHPSRFGYKDVCNAWKAEQWDPERLIQLYKRAGAKYFVALANHHCNFDCWDSAYQPWNSVNVGPRKDIVGAWARLARKHGLRFGVTVHSARAWSWYEVAHASDSRGPFEGIPYDGALTKADGKGQWWEGLDPADLYGPHGDARTPQAYQAYVDKWFRRTKDLIDKYQPDLLYFDDTVPPLGEAGMSAVAHLLNANLQQHGGSLEAVYNTKIYDFHPPADIYGRLVNDFEGGRADRIEPYPWQTDTCIGNWHYFRGIKYRTAESVIHELVDVVSKNGNLLLNVPLPGDGTLDADELKFLDELARWMAVNGEGIYGTRPWLVYGEGEKDADGTFVHDGRNRSFTGSDIRFTRKGDVIYATFLAWPGQRALIRSLARSASDVRVSDVGLLGHEGSLSWEQTDEGLSVRMPREKPCQYAFVLRIGTGTHASRSSSGGT